MKRWISFSSHLCASVTSFVALSVAPVVAYGAVALTRSWQSGVPGDASSVLAVPVLSALGAGTFAFAAAPVLSLVAQNWTRRFNWTGAMFPALLACAATCALSVVNALFGWEWSSSAIIGSGIATGTAFGTYWLPLRWAQKVLLGWDEKYIALHKRCERKPKALSVPFATMEEKEKEWEGFGATIGSRSERKTRPRPQGVRVQ